MYSKLDINRNIKTTDTHAHDMHMGFFFSFSKAVLHNIMKLLSLGQLLQLQFTLDTTAVCSGTPRRSEQSALQGRRLNLGDRLNRSPFLVGEGWGRTGVSFKKRINKKRKKKNRPEYQKEKVQDVVTAAAERDKQKYEEPPSLPPLYSLKMYDLKLSISCIRPRTGKTRQGRSIPRNILAFFSKPSDTTRWRLFTTEMAVLCCWVILNKCNGLLFPHKRH